MLTPRPWADAREVDRVEALVTVDDAARADAFLAVRSSSSSERRNRRPGSTGTGSASRRLRQVQVRSSMVPSGLRASTVAVTSAVRIRAVQLEPTTQDARKASGRAAASTRARTSRAAES